nr:unnamed protein product [Callosobruchus chinensis]
MFKHVAARQDKKYLIRCSYVEIYNEKINDLLDKGNQTVVIREDPKGNMLLNVREAVVSSISDVLEKMQEGNKLRRIGVTSMNQRSSRSHTIFRIILESKDASDDDKHVHISQLNLVDLAGSERLAKSKAAGKRLKEGVNINKSLSTLGIVIRQLSEGKRQFVSYRDSKLTRLLTQALGGNAKSVIIANITLVAGEETKSTLEFAQRAKKVKNKPKVNILSARDEAYQSMKQNLERRIKKQVEVLEEMERHREECFREMERLKVESTIVGHFQSGTPAKQPQKLIRRLTFADYGPSSSRQSKKSPQGGSSRKFRVSTTYMASSIS